MNPTLFELAELVGIAAAAVSGVLTAAQVSLDLFGAIVLGCITAFGGGIIRDLLLGITPPAAFRDPTMLLIAAGVSLSVFLLEYFFGDRMKAADGTKSNRLLRFVCSRRYEQLFNIFDALGLAIFVIVGVRAADNAGYNDNTFLSVFVGTVTGIGGGMLRDITIGKIPVVLQKHIYALAAIFGAVLYVFLPRIGCPESAALYIAVLSILLIRFLAAHYRWNMPHYPKKDRTSDHIQRKKNHETGKE